MGNTLLPKRVSPAQPYRPVILTVQGHVEGVFSTQPKGILVHSTRSTNQTNNQLQEFYGTLNYVRGGADGLGWNATCGPNILAIHMQANQWAWNAREDSLNYIAIEHAQANLNDPIDDNTLKASAYYIKHYVLPMWPKMPLSIIHHSELPAGIRDGKTDVYSRTDTLNIKKFNNRLYDLIKEV